MLSDVVSVSLVVVGDMYGVVSVTYADGTIVAKEFDLDVPELNKLDIGSTEVHSEYVVSYVRIKGSQDIRLANSKYVSE